MGSNGAKILLLSLPPRLQFSSTKKATENFYFRNIIEERIFNRLFIIRIALTNRRIRIITPFIRSDHLVKAEISLLYLFYFEKTLIYSTAVL